MAWDHDRNGSALGMMIRRAFIILLFVNSIYGTKTLNFRNPFVSSRGKVVKDVDVLVVGAGLCGSTASFYLNKKGINTMLVEENNVVGGCIVSKHGKSGMMLCKVTISIMRMLFYQMETLYGKKEQIPFSRIKEFFLWREIWDYCPIWCLPTQIYLDIYFGTTHYIHCQ